MIAVQSTDALSATWPLPPGSPPKNKIRVVAAMSGGVDSAVTAALLVREGYDVIGITMQLWPDDLPFGEHSESGCCSLTAVEDARRTANRLGIPYYVVNFQQSFQSTVIDAFADEYLRGETPNPCLMCNQTVKFGMLLQKALELDADYVATGHYARIGFDPAKERWVVLKSKDVDKDQTYTFYGQTQEQLARTLTPCGDYTKEEIRAMAREWKLGVASKPDSQEICFVPDNDYRRFLRDYRPDAHVPGPIVDKEGRVLGSHDGIAFYTVGQRKGLRLNVPERMYVVEIDAANNTVVVGDEKDVLGTALAVRDVNWVGVAGLDGPMSVQAKIRYNSSAADAVIQKGEGDEVLTRLIEPQRAISPGQAVVWYDGDLLVGGGTIDRQLPGAREGEIGHTNGRALTTSNATKRS